VRANGGVSIPPVIYEDDALVAFDKPARPPGAGALPNAPSEAANFLVAARAKFGADLAFVHRLDAETSGVLLCAKTKPALDFLSGQFQARTAAPVWHALVFVLPPERLAQALVPLRGLDGALPETFVVELGMEEDQHQAGRMHVFKRHGGKPALTEFRTMERFGGGHARGGGGYAWVECRPRTARKHQVRAHLATAGAPVLNDAIYGDPTDELRLSALKRGYKNREEEKPLLTRLALHAGELTVKHPVTREPLKLSAPLPHEFELALKYLRKFARASR
jgi:23S rRNA pseudouridine1911/1915/1917 synthase